MTFSGEGEPIRGGKPKWLRARKRKTKVVKTTEGKRTRIERHFKELRRQQEGEA